MRHRLRLAKVVGLADAPVFCTRSGSYQDKKNVLRAFKSLVRKFNAANPTTPIPARLRFHDLRHTVVSLLLSQGHSVKAVASRIGHSNPTVTLKVYGHLIPGDDDKLVAALEDMS